MSPYRAGSKGRFSFFNPYSPYVDDCHIGFSGAKLRAIIHFGILMASGIASQGRRYLAIQRSN